MWCYVFDYSAPGIYEFESDEKDNDLSNEEMLERRGLDIDNCYILCSNDKLSVEPINLKDDESVSNK